MAANRRQNPTLVAFFRPTYAAYGRDLGLYRTLLRENVFHPASQHAEGFDRLRLETISHLQSVISLAQHRGELKRNCDPALGARAVFLLFFAAVRSWIAAERPDVEDGLRDLRMMYEWGRGSKRPTIDARRRRRTVAPRMGAWIETRR